MIFETSSSDQRALGNFGSSGNLYYLDTPLGCESGHFEQALIHQTYVAREFGEQHTIAVVTRLRAFRNVVGDEHQTEVLRRLAIGHFRRFVFLCFGIRVLWCRHLRVHQRPSCHRPSAYPRMEQPWS